MQSTSTFTRPSDEEVAKEVRNFQGRLTLQPNLWTLADLKSDFKRLRGDDYSTLASVAAGTGKALTSFLQPTGAPFELLAKAKEFLADKAKESIAGHIVDISLQSATEEESKAGKEFVTELGSTIIMGVFAGHVPGLVFGALFTIIIYLYKSEKERQKKADDKLAEKLWENWERIREKSQRKVDARNEKEIEAFLRSSWAQDQFDEEILLKYQHKKFGLLNVKASNCIDLLKVVSSQGLPSQLHAAKAFAVFQIIPGEESRLDEGMRAKVAKWLIDLVKAEEEKRAVEIRRLMAGENYLRLTRMKELVRVAHMSSLMAAITSKFVKILYREMRLVTERI